MKLLNRRPQSREIIFGGYALTLLALLTMGMVAFFQVRNMSRELERVSLPFWYQLAQRELLTDLMLAESSLRTYGTILEPASGRRDPLDLKPLRSGAASHDTKLFLMEKFYTDEAGFTPQMKELMAQKYQLLAEWEDNLRTHSQRPGLWTARLQSLSDTLRKGAPLEAVGTWLATAYQARRQDSLEEVRLYRRLRALRTRELQLEEQMQDLLVGQRGIANNQEAIVENTRQNRQSERAQDSIFLVMILLLISGLLLLRLIDRILANNRALYRSLEAEKARAEELAKAKETFLANMSHEIRTPMFAVTGFADRLASTSLTEAQRAMLNPIRKAGGYLRDLLNEILDYSKLESGHFTLEETGFRPARIVEEVEATFRHRARDKGIGLTCQGEDLPEVLTGDPMRLRQMLFNLVSNAIKFTETGGVTLQARVHEAADERVWLEFAVTDTGIGIAPEQIERIFSDFIQADSSTTRKYGGTGLGLTITKRLAELQGGRISVASQPGTGTTFTLHLPYRPGSLADLEPEATPEWVAGQPLAGKRLLLADDEPFNQQLISGILTDWGAEVTVAGDGQAALDRLLAESFDAGLLDLRMPELDGTEVARRYRAARGETLPLLALTATALGSELSRAREAGMDAHLIKPFRPVELVQVLARLLELPPPETAAAPVDTAGSQEAATGTLDLRELTQLTRGNPRQMRRLLEIFQENMARYLPAMQAALEAGDHTALAGVAHKLVPACRHLGFTELAADIKDLELAAQAGAEPDSYPGRVAAIQGAIEGLLPAVAEAMAKLERG